MRSAFALLSIVFAATSFTACTDGGDVRRTSYADGRPWSELHFEHGKLNGLATTWHKSGNKAREGSYLDDHMHGVWRTWQPDGTLLLEANFVRGHPDGPWLERWENGNEKYRGQYKDGRPDGLWVESFVNGQRSIEGSYVRGERNGVWRGWNPDGSSKGSALYENGQFVRKID